MAQDVVVHCADHEQTEAAARVVRDATVLGTVVVGTLEAPGADRLRAQGLAVDVVDEGGTSSPVPTRLARVVGAVRPLRRLALTVDRLPASAHLATAEEGVEVDVCVIRFRGPLLPSWREMLHAESVMLLSRGAPFEWTAKVPASARRSVAGLPFVTGLRSYHPLETCDPGLLRRVAGGRATWRRAIGRRYELVTHDAADAPDVAKTLAGLGADPRPGLDATVRFELAPHAGMLADIARLPAVAQLVEDRPGEPCNDRARALVRMPAAPMAQAGSGQLVAVADSGVDGAHPDLTGSVSGSARYGAWEPDHDADGHGTHVAATIAGTGAASGGQLQGVAPGVRLHVQSIADGTGHYVTDTDTLQRVLADAYKAGARIHNDSWAIPGGDSSYRPQSRVIDEFVAGRPDLLVVTAAGNSARWPGPRSIDAPGTAKNALVVGAARGDRRGVETPERTWADFDAAFKPAPFAAQSLSGDPETLAGFSGRGPSNDYGRVKPDVVAPGTFVLSARSADATRPYWAACQDPPRYAYDGGTSMAAAVVSGCAAVLREHLVSVRKHEPSAALLKAMLIAGARWLGGRDAVADNPTAPNFHQGFGCISMDTTLPDDAAGRGVEFDDRWKEVAVLRELGDAVRFDFDAGGALPLSVCLAWTDPPGAAIQNSLVLSLMTPERRDLWGNAGRTRGTFEHPDNQVDRANNVQVIRAETPTAGTYSIQVSADDMAGVGQTFALVVNGAVTGGLTQTYPEAP
jgi:hypothetical protein